MTKTNNKLAVALAPFSPFVTGSNEEAIFVKSLDSEKLKEVRSAIKKVGFALRTNEAGKIQPLKQASGTKHAGDIKFKIVPIVTETEDIQFDEDSKKVSRTPSSGLTLPMFIKLIQGDNPSPFWKELTLNDDIEVDADGNENHIYTLNVSDDKGIPASAKPQKHMADKVSWTVSDFANYVLSQACRSYVKNGGKILSADIFESKMDLDARVKRERSEMDVTGTVVSTIDNRSGFTGNKNRLVTESVKRIMTLDDSQESEDSEDDDSNGTPSEVPQNGTPIQPQVAKATNRAERRKASKQN